MRHLAGVMAGFTITLVAGDVLAQQRPDCTPAAVPSCPPGGVPQTLPYPYPSGQGMGNTAPGQPGQPDPLANAFAQGNEGGGASARSFNDAFNGDFCGLFVKRRIPTGTTTTTVVGTGINARDVTTADTRVVVTASSNRYNGSLITDNDGPRPMDRVYFGYNYYNGIGTSLHQGISRVDMYRETVGFEKTFLDGNASIGLRMPFVQLNGPPGIETANAGDLNVILKYAFYNNRETGDVASAGLQLTFPTGNGNDVLADGSLITESVLFQPFLGGVKVWERGYAQGITSIVVPTDRRDPLLFNNSVGFGWFLYQNADDRIVKAVVPCVEFHVRSPLNHLNTDAPIFFQDQLNITTGVHFRMQNATISPAICVPTLDYRAYNAEFSLAVNVRY